MGMAEQKRILVVEDDEELMKLICMHLERRGHAVLSADNGRDGLVVAKKETPDLVLLDVMLPQIDGYHVAQELTEKPGHEAPPIIIMTSRNVDKERPLAKMSGARAVLQKPLNLDELDAEIKKAFA